MKSVARHIIVGILSWQIRRLRRRHEFKVVAVTGSIGKTSTKFAISAVLSQKFRVRFQEGNYNDLVTVPLVFFDTPLPGLLNPLAWIMTLVKNERQIWGKFPYDVVVLELGTDGPGQIAQFARYGMVDVGVVTAIAPEHMEFFKTIEAVAKEEMALSTFSEVLLVNRDLCDPRYLGDTKSASYGIHRASDYQVKDAEFQADHFVFKIQKTGEPWLGADHRSFAEIQLYSLASAAAVADIFGMSSDEIVAGFNRVKAVSGRMQLLNGTNNTLIIDDTYNASPDAVLAVLDTLYTLKAPQRIALLGNMNELGEYSEQAHRAVGEHCDPTKLDLVITLGVDANNYLASAAESKGCTVIRAESPKDAANKIKEALKTQAVILAKGSQNGVFAEEAVKELLANPADVAKLVRQSSYWMKIKQQQFS